MPGATQSGIPRARRFSGRTPVGVIVTLVAQRIVLAHYSPGPHSTIWSFFAPYAAYRPGDP
jgi:hypothetical protein